MSEISRDQERWLPVPGYEHAYEVSDWGRVRSLDREINAPQSGGRRRIRGRILQPVVHPDGRRHVSLRSQGKCQKARIYVLVLEAFIALRPLGMNGCHNDGDPANDCLSNLRWDTQSANMLDKRKHGTDHEVNKKSCPLGHGLEAPNLVPSVLRRGRRDCLACSRARAAKQEARRRGRRIDFQREAHMRYQHIMEEAS